MGRGCGSEFIDLHARVHRGTYRVQPSKRTYILKEDGRLRPLGISALEDKIVQRAVVTVLEQIYEEEFLGFSYGFRHICGKNWKGGFTIRRKTVGKRLRRKLKEIRAEQMRRRHGPIPEQGEWMRAVVQGYFNYFAVSGNSDALNVFRTAVCRSWRRALKRRSQKSRLPWQRVNRYVARWLPSVRSLHPPPYVRLALDPR